jgi:hypothetical protein
MSLLLYNLSLLCFGTWTFSLSYAPFKIELYRGGGASKNKEGETRKRIKTKFFNQPKALEGQAYM